MAAIGSFSLRQELEERLEVWPEIERLQLPVVDPGQQGLLVEGAVEVGVHRALVTALDELEAEEQSHPSRQKLHRELDGAPLGLAQGVVIADQHQRAFEPRR